MAREYQEEVMIPGVVDWDLWERIESFAISRISNPTVRWVPAQLVGGGRINAKTVTEARSDHAQDPVDFEVFEARVGDDSGSIETLITPASRHGVVYIKSTDRDWAQQTAADLRLAVGVDPSPSAQPEDDDSISPEIHRDVEVCLRAVREALESGELRLSADQTAELQALLESAEAQLRSPRPSRRVLKAAFGVMRRVLEGAAGNALLQAILRVLGAL